MRNACTNYILKQANKQTDKQILYNRSHETQSIVCGMKFLGREINEKKKKKTKEMNVSRQWTDT